MLLCIGNRQTRQLDDGREQIDQLDDRGGGLSGLSSGNPHDQGNARADLEIGVFSPVVLLAQVPTVIAPQYDQRVVRETEAL